MNICILGSRRSATTALANTLYSAMSAMELRVQQQIEPFTWHMVQIDNVRQGEAHRIERDFHESIPILCGPGFKSERLDRVMEFDGANVVKFNLALGRIPLIANYPDTVTIHIFRSPVWVINSLRHLNFNLGTVGIGRVRNDWDFFCDTVAPYLKNESDLVRNAARWAIENLAAAGVSDLMFSYKSLLEDPMEIAEKIAALTGCKDMKHFFQGYEARDTSLILDEREVKEIEQAAGAAYEFLLSCEDL